MRAGLVQVLDLDFPRVLPFEDEGWPPLEQPVCI